MRCRAKGDVNLKERIDILNIFMEGQRVKQVKQFKYLGWKKPSLDQNNDRTEKDCFQQKKD